MDYIEKHQLLDFVIWLGEQGVKASLNFSFNDINTIEIWRDYEGYKIDLQISIYEGIEVDKVIKQVADFVRARNSCIPKYEVVV